jgi:phage-related tail fiber protein
MDFDRSAGGILLPVSNLAVGGRFVIDHMRNGELIDREELSNLVVNEGLNHILDVVLHGASQVGTWYLGLFEGNYTPVATVTAATITAAATETTAYDESTRVAYDEAAASGQSITNAASKATFTMNASKTIYGAFLISAAAKSATTGVLLSAARFGSSKAVVDDDQLLLTYTFSASSV